MKSLVITETRSAHYGISYSDVFSINLQGHSDFETDCILLEIVSQVFLFIYLFHFYTFDSGNNTNFYIVSIKI